MDNKPKITKQFVDSNTECVMKTRELQGVDIENMQRLLPEPQEIKIRRTILTKDAVLLNYYYKLAQRGQFGKRLAYLMTLDAYGQIPDSNFDNLSEADKLNSILTTVNKLTEIIARTQRVSETNIATQSRVLKLIQDLSNSVKEQGMLTELVKYLMLNENYTEEQLKELLVKVSEDIKKQNQKVAGDKHGI